MPNPCREAVYFFISVYLVILILSSIYLSLGFPCDPYDDLLWNFEKGKPMTLNTLPNLPFGRRRNCWTECEAYALRVHFLRNPHLNNNPTLALFHSLLYHTQPNPFCFLSPPNHDPFCDPEPPPLDFSMEERRMAKKSFEQTKAASKFVHRLALSTICLDCIVACLVIVLIYLSIYPKKYPYAATFAVALSAHLASLFISSYITNWLTCKQGEQRFCDGVAEISIGFGPTVFRTVLPDKPAGTSNYEIAIVIKNVNLVGLFILCLCYFSMQRVFDADRRGEPIANGNVNRVDLAPGEPWEEVARENEDAVAPGD